MECNHETLIAMVLGDLDEEGAREIESHVESCQACAARLKELRQTTGLLASLPEAEHRPVALDRLWAEIDAPPEKRRPRATIVLDWAARHWRAGMAVAAAAAFLILCFGYGVSIRVGPDFQLALGPQYQSVAPETPDTRLAQATPLRPEEVRAIVRSEMSSEIKPAILSIVGTIQDFEANVKARFASLQDDFYTKRALDRAAVERNMRLLAATVDESVSARPVGYRPPLYKIDENE